MEKRVQGFKVNENGQGELQGIAGDPCKVGPGFGMSGYIDNPQRIGTDLMQNKPSSNDFLSVEQLTELRVRLIGFAMQLKQNLQTFSDYKDASVIDIAKELENYVSGID